MQVIIALYGVLDAFPSYQKPVVLSSSSLRVFSRLLLIKLITAGSRMFVLKAPTSLLLIWTGILTVSVQQAVTEEKSWTGGQVITGEVTHVASTVLSIINKERVTAAQPSDRFLNVLSQRTAFIYESISKMPICCAPRADDNGQM